MKFSSSALILALIDACLFKTSVAFDRYQLDYIIDPEGLPIVTVVSETLDPIIADFYFQAKAESFDRLQAHVYSFATTDSKTSCEDGTFISAISDGAAVSGCNEDEVRYNYIVQNGGVPWGQLVQSGAACGQVSLSLGTANLLEIVQDEVIPEANAQKLDLCVRVGYCYDDNCDLDGQPSSSRYINYRDIRLQVLRSLSAEFDNISAPVVTTSSVLMKGATATREFSVDASLCQNDRSLYDDNELASLSFEPGQEFHICVGLQEEPGYAVSGFIDMVCEDDNTLISPPEGDIRNDDITFVDASTQPLLLSQVVTIELAEGAGADGSITCSGRVNLSPVEAPEWEYYTKTSGTCDDDAQGQLIATEEECRDAGGTANGGGCCGFDSDAPTGCTLPLCGCDIMPSDTQCLQPFPACSEDAPCLCKRPKSDWEYYEKTSGRCTDDGELIPYEAECRANGGTANGNGCEFAWLAEFGLTSPPSGCTSPAIPAMVLTLPIAECLQFPDCSEDLPCICRRLADATEASDAPIQSPTRALEASDAPNESPTEASDADEWDYYSTFSGRCIDDGQLIMNREECIAVAKDTANWYSPWNGVYETWRIGGYNINPPMGCSIFRDSKGISPGWYVFFIDNSLYENIIWRFDEENRGEYGLCGTVPGDDNGYFDCICKRPKSERKLQAEKNVGQFFLTIKISSSAASTSIGILSVIMGSIVAVYAM